MNIQNARLSAGAGRFAPARAKRATATDPGGNLGLGSAGCVWDGWIPGRSAKVGQGEEAEARRRREVDASSAREPPHEVVLVAARDLDRGDAAGLEILPVLDQHAAVDLRRVALGAAEGTILARLVDDHLERAADLGGEAGGGDRLLARHEAGEALLLDLLRYRTRQVVGRGTLDRLVLEAADPVELSLAEPVEQELEVG